MLIIGWLLVLFVAVTSVFLFFGVLASVNFSIGMGGGKARDYWVALIPVTIGAYAWYNVIYNAPFSIVMGG